MRSLAAIFVALLCTPILAQSTQPSAAAIGSGKVVGLDEFFNHQVRGGKQFHYIWQDTAITGYSKFGQVWEQYGATLASLHQAPTRDDLNRFSIFIIANPSIATSKYSPNPNYMTPADADTIAAWVNDGGVLALFANDKYTCEFEHFNVLPEKFGIRYSADLRNAVPNSRDRTPGTFFSKDFPADCPLFKGVAMIFMKEISTIHFDPPANALLKVENEQHTGKDVIMATCHYGKGFVFAVGDPWFYNEYIDVRSTPGLHLQNRLAAENFCRWMLGIAKPPMRE